MFLFDVPPFPSTSPLAIGIGFGFFLILAAVAFVAFKMMKRTLKMAFRMVIVAAILLIAVVGSIVLYVSVGLFTGSGPRTHPPRPPAANSRK